mmetsp:Transcript_32496/g.75787  ORF Transcript_32496/g.75787 Transcript_32496/m.75787 type:complete len:562 (-) Transcript_32496:253-1938(-)
MVRLAVSVLALLGAACAEEEAEAVNASAYAPPSSPLEGAVFFEPFTAPSVAELSQWTVSDDEEFTGEWKIETFAEPEGLEGDTGLVVSSQAKRHAIATVFDKPFSPAGVGLVVQYELQLKEGLTCGGAYIKLLRASDDLSLTGFKASTPYTVMFGPDKCGNTNKVHFILQHKRPNCDECTFEEKHLVSPPVPKSDTGTHLYTAIVTADNLVKILVDGEEVLSKSLLDEDSFSPAVNPRRYIDDPTDKKPSGWVDLPKMDDPAASKPEDWDEDAPKKIVDAAATKPDEWYEDEPLKVPDAKATTPEDWDEDEDGEWEAPIIDNPKCKYAGCGEWAAPMIDNPAYKGKWSAPQIDNPDYIGVWTPKQVDNPEYAKYVDESPHAMAPIGGVGIELWTMQNGILFDNIMVGGDADVAKALAAATFDRRLASEKEIAARPKDIKRKPGFFGTVEYFAAHAVFYCIRNWLKVASALLLGLLPIFFICCRSTGGKPPSHAALAAAAADEDEDEDDGGDDDGAGGAEAAADDAAGAGAAADSAQPAEATPTEVAAPKPSPKSRRTKKAD